MLLNAKGEPRTGGGGAKAAGPKAGSSQPKPVARPAEKADVSIKIGYLSHGERNSALEITCYKINCKERYSRSKEFIRKIDRGDLVVFMCHDFKLLNCSCPFAPSSVELYFQTDPE